MSSPATNIALKLPHSAGSLGAWRMEWWNKDYLSFLKGKWSAHADARKLLDVGCGVGHWLRTISPHFPALEEITAVDREATWVELLKQQTFDLPVTVLQAKAEQLPFPDGTFDVATCQTLLIHVKSPEIVLREMIRVLKPGGLLIVAESNCLLGYYPKLGDKRLTPEQTADIFLYWQYVERGRKLLGEGDFMLGETLANLLVRVGLKDTEVRNNDKDTGCAVMTPEIREASLKILELQKAHKLEQFDDAAHLRYVKAAGMDDSVWIRCMESIYAANELLFEDVRTADSIASSSARLFIGWGTKRSPELI